MCLSVGFGGLAPAINRGQALAGKGVFFSRPRHWRAFHDDPLPLSLLRMHIAGRHAVGQSMAERPALGEYVSESYVFAEHVNIPVATADNPDSEAFRQAILADTPVARGFWGSRDHTQLYVGPEVLSYCASGRWAAVWGARPIEGRRLDDGDAATDGATFGAWRKDGYGCYLSYLLPVGQEIQLDGEFEAGRAGLIYQVGSLAVKVRLSTAPTWGVWVRCSDTGLSSGFLVGQAYQGKQGGAPQFVALLASTFPAPHAFPARGYFFTPEPAMVPAVENSLAGAVALAEHIAERGGFESTPPSPQPAGHCYDALLAEHAAGRLGAFAI